MKIQNLEVQDGVIIVQLINVYDLDQKISVEMTTDLEVTRITNDSLNYGNDLVNEINLLKSHIKEITSAYE